MPPQSPSPAAAQSYLAPDIEDLHDPFLLRDLDVAVERIQRALGAKERIFVHGDYDVDGITSTFVLCTVLQELGGRVEVRIPHRTRDGYGLSVEAMEEARRRGCGLVITVDCGVTAVEAVERGRALGWVHLWWNLGMALGGLAGGALIEWQPGAPFWVASAGNLATVALAVRFFNVGTEAASAD